jgi:hypothetical protein
MTGRVISPGGVLSLTDRLLGKLEAGSGSSDDVPVKDDRKLLRRVSTGECSILAATAFLKDAIGVRCIIVQTGRLMHR